MSNTRDNSGSFSANKRKEKDTHPDIKGKATINGVEYWMDGWRKENDNGIWYSVSFKPKDAPPAEAPKPATRGRDGSAGWTPLDDDIPFAPETRA